MSRRRDLGWHAGEVKVDTLPSGFGTVTLAYNVDFDVWLAERDGATYVKPGDLSGKWTLVKAGA